MRRIIMIIHLILFSVTVFASDKAHDLFNDFIKQKNDTDRIKFVRKLTDIKTQKVIPYLIKILELNVTYSVKRNAVFGMYLIVKKEDRKSLDKVVALLKTEKYPYLVEEYLTFIGEKGNSSYTSLVVSYLLSPSAIIRSSAVAALHKIGDKTCVPHLEALLKKESSYSSESRDIRKSAIAIIAKLGDSSNIKELKKIVENNKSKDKEELRQYAILGIDTINRREGKITDKSVKKDSELTKNIFKDNYFSNEDLYKIAMIKKNIKKNPSDPDLYLDLGNMYLKTQKFFLAENSFVKAKFLFKRRMIIKGKNK